MKTWLVLLMAILLVGCGSGGKASPPPYVPPIPEPTPEPIPELEPIPEPEPEPDPEPEPCVVTLSWELPTEYEDGLTLDPLDIAILTVYAGRIPDAPDEELAFVVDVDPHLLLYQWVWEPDSVGMWYFTATVTVNEVESRRSNEAVKECAT